MLRVASTVSVSRGDHSHITPQADAGRSVLRDIVAPLAAHERSYFSSPGGLTIAFGGPQSPMAGLAGLWRDLIAMPETISLLPTTLYSASTRTGASRALVNDVNAGRAFGVVAVPPSNHGRLEVRPPMMTGAGAVVFGQTAAGAPSSVYVAYLTASGALGRSPDPHDVFRQAKTSETLVHEIMVHGVALLATNWRTGMPFANHADGFGSSFMRDPARWPSYQSPLRPGDFGIPALLRDCDAGHLERGLPYERDAYYGVTRGHGLNRNTGVWGPSHEHRRDQVRFLRSRAREQPGRESP